MKADCYKCVYRRKIPGDAHSRCAHPAVGCPDNAFKGMVQTMYGRFQEAADRLEIRAIYTGIKRGYFIWPANFDPVWLENCNGFEQLEGKGDE